MLSNVEFAFLTRMNWAGLEWRMPVHPILSIKNNRGRSSPYQLDNRRWRIGGLCPIVKLSMPKQLGEKKKRLFIRNFTQTTVLVDSDVFLQGQIKTKYNKENLCKLFFLLVAFFGTRKIYLLSTDCMWEVLSPVDFTQSFYHLGV